MAPGSAARADATAAEFSSRGVSGVPGKSADGTGGAGRGNRRRIGGSVTCLAHPAESSRAATRLDGCVAFPALVIPVLPHSRATGRRGRIGSRRAHRARTARPGRPPGGGDGPAAAVPERAFRDVHPGPEPAQPVRGRRGPERLRRGHRRRRGPVRRQAALVRPERQEGRGPLGPARRLPGRRIRRRQDAPAGLPLARDPRRARAQGVRHVRGADEPGRRTRIPADGADAQRSPPAVHRRVRTGRPR